jgi:hypothetical protein
VTYSIDVDPLAEQQISALPQPALTALTALTDALGVLELVPWNGRPLNDANPDGPVRQLPFGDLGMITYLILDDQQRVDLLIVTWPADGPPAAVTPRPPARRRSPRPTRRTSSGRRRARTARSDIVS